MPGLGDISSQLDELAHLIKPLQQQITQLADNRRTENQMLDEIQNLRANQIAVLLVPGAKRLVDAMRLADDMSSADYSAYNAEDLVSLVSKEAEHMSDLIDQALEALGFNSLNALPGQRFNSRMHHAKDRATVGEKDLDKTIATVLRQGYQYAEERRASLPAQVVVYKYDPALDTPGSENVQQDGVDTKTTVDQSDRSDDMSA